MPTDRTLRWLALAAALTLLAACQTDQAGIEGPASTFGEANRQTMLAQVIDPEPQYDADATSSADHAAQAVERYRTDKVKLPDRVKVQGANSGGGSGGR
jgi:uncharacterized lipoprotein YajG